MASEPPELAVVGVGASAGGLDAMGRVVAGLPSDADLTFVVLQHQAESQAGRLAAILAPLATLPVINIEDGMKVAANRIYIVPPHTRATLTDGKFAIAPTGAASPIRPIDELFTSLASTHGARAAGIVLSGTGNDGTAGLRAIHTAGGVTIAQDPSTAEHDEMPRSAITAGVVDMVLSPDGMGAEFTRRRGERSTAIGRILQQLRELSGIDFSTYKRATIERRLDRQLARHHMESIDEYATYLAAHPAEARALYEDLLVHVTEFFRDAEVFDLVASHAIPELLAAKPPGATLRVWVPGCSTGEEVYSLAILLLDALAERGDPRTIQMFGTDLSERAIEVARAGRYPATIRDQIGEPRFARYFVADGNGVRVATSVRERCVFVRHDLAADPPFSRLDLVSCRNLLIYLGPILQKRIIPLLHYALEQPGFLVLGTSETISGHETLFAPVVAGAPLYRRKPSVVRPTLVFPGRSAAGVMRRHELSATPDPYREADHVLLARYAPPCVVVDESFDVVQFRGRTGAFLEPAPGHPQVNVFKMLRDRLSAEVRTAILRAQRDNVSVRAEDLLIDGESSRRVDVEVIPLRTSNTRHFLIVFEEQTPASASQPSVRRGGSDRLEHLEQELAAAREYLSTVLAQHVATGEELGVLNEELQSTNEELQSSNEELQTAKEELQSTNDELENLNNELERGNTELRKTNDDLVNVLISVDVAIIIVDSSLRVRRFTPKARALFKLIESDVGRPIADLKPSFVITDLDATIASVIETLVIHEREVRDAVGNIYRMHVRPYRTSEQQIGGAVISFVDITALRASLDESRRAREAESAAHDTLTREKDAFLHAVSHELRTPLSAIILWAEVLRQLAPSLPEVVRAVETIEASARAEAQLVEDLIDLALSRTNSEALLFAVQRIDPSAVVDDTLAALRPSADEKKLTVVTELDRDARVQADPRRLRQIIWHLLTNAIKFTPAGGRVAVSVARRAEMVELVVSDNGKGVHPSFVSNVFEPFSQEDHSSTRAFPGLGIGLAFVRHLVERQGGTIQVASPGEDRGSSFTVRLPAA